MHSRPTESPLLAQLLANIHAMAWEDHINRSRLPMVVNRSEWRGITCVEVVNYETGQVVQHCHWEPSGDLVTEPVA